ncbi:nidogen-1, partial [Biomphalaria glabrata]
MILTAIIVAGLVTLSQQAAISTGYRDGNCSASAYLYCDPNANCVDAPETQQYTCQCQANATGDGFKTEVGGTGCKY